ncbi:DUF2842 domain-containing protein [Sphingomonas sp. FW199]|uniref:DUF2842 domain-containing protein n=1 Tax=Sphingomonas sp. FW199 TaxID=3400217 RepID=UPI003CF3F7D8
MNDDLPSWRKPVGALSIIGIILIWIVLIASLSDYLAMLWWPVQAVFYLIAGIVWILPLKPLLRWMETGRWR